MNILVEKVLPNPEQPRTVFDSDELEELAASIKEHGVILPISVEKADDGFFVLHDGERRWRAAQLAGMKEIPATIEVPNNGNGSRERLERALVANIQREDTNPIDLAKAFGKLRDDHKLSIKEIGKRIGKPGAAGYAYVRNRLILLELDEEIQNLIAQGKLQKSQILVDGLLSIPDRNARVQLAKRIAKRRLTVKGGLRACVRVREALASDGMGDETPAVRFAQARALKDAPDWQVLALAGRVPPWDVVVKCAVGTCRTCPLREVASSTVCEECGVVDLLRRLLAYDDAR